MSLPYNQPTTGPDDSIHPSPLTHRPAYPSQDSYMVDEKTPSSLSDEKDLDKLPTPPKEDKFAGVPTLADEEGLPAQAAPGEHLDIPWRYKG
jgi:hypothetical protein